MALTAVVAQNLVKSFTIRKQKSLKENIVNARRGRAFAERFRALDDISFQITAGESVGLVGPNGSGKSTLLKIVGGILAPNQGRVQVRGRLAALLELGAGFHPDLSGRDNIYLNASLLGLSRAETERYFADIVDFSGIPDFIDTQVKFYSSGMYVRLAFAVAVHVDPDILLVDEVLAVGDEPFQAKCMDKIRQFKQEGRTIVFVSHSTAQVTAVCDRAIVLEHGRIVEDDTPLIALGRLRQAYQGQIEATRQADAGSGDGRATIASVRLSSPGSYDYAGFDVVGRPGLTLEARCEIDFDQPVPGWSADLSIETTLGDPRLLTDSRDCLKMDLPAAAGRQGLVWRLPDLRLGEGDYVVNLAVRDQAGVRLDVRSRAAMFAIRRADLSRGPVYSEATLELVAPQPAPPAPATASQAGAADGSSPAAEPEERAGGRP
ncbi:MAG: ABC transporter ATP-binding protein [Propionibacteriaceae bacterium]|jgi:ABC-2 type transport system ATP-binding protein|nr:ABC transporter ATP-binding protein [Propionibacteriaceae bacterium]